MVLNYIAFYKKQYVRFDDFVLPDTITGDDFVKDWVQMKIIKAENSEDALETVYMKMQGEFWSPHGEAREQILASGTGHTSMSIGDIINSPDGKFWMVDMIGFKEIHLTN